jgi:hypothetical protein
MLEPAFSGKKVDEHEPVEESLNEQFLGFTTIICVREALDESLNAFEDLSILLEEGRCDGFDVEGIFQGQAQVLLLLPVMINVGELLEGGPPGQVPLDDHAAQSRGVA